MIDALIRKEFRQHGTAFLVLGGLLLLGLWNILANPLLRRIQGSGFETVSFLLKTLVPIGALVLSNMLVAAEFRHKTQLFLEGLPLPRWRMLAVKYALMLGTLITAVMVATGAAGWQSRHSEVMTRDFAGILLAKTLCWTWFVGTVFFALGFLGKYRVALGLFAVIGLMWAHTSGWVDLGRTAPFSLVDARFAFEREVWPVSELAATVAWAVVFTIIGFALGLVRDATIAALLAERMSAREKAWVTLLLLGVVALIGMAEERRENREAVRLPGAMTWEEPGIRLEVSSAHAPDDGDEEIIARAGTNFFSFLTDMSGLLDRPLPPVFVVHRPDLRGSEIEDGKLPAAQGVLMRANLTAKDFSHAQFERELTRSILTARTHGRSQMERWAWVADGLPLWWSLDRGTNRAGQDQLTSLVTQAHSGRTNLVAGGDFFRRWSTLRQKAGQEPAAVFSWATLAALAQEKGSGAVVGLAKACFGRPVPHDARAWWNDVMDPPEHRLSRTTGLDFKELRELLDHFLDSQVGGMPL